MLWWLLVSSEISPDDGKRKVREPTTLLKSSVPTEPEETWCMDCMFAS